MNRHTFVIVSLVAITVLGGIAAALALVNDDDPDQIGAEPAPATGPDFDGVTFTDPQGAYRLDVDPTWETDPEPSARGCRVVGTSTRARRPTAST